MPTEEQQELRKKIQVFLQDNIPNQHIEDDDDIFKLGYVNSLFSLKLIGFIESAFSISILDDELDIANFNSIDAMTSFVHAKKTALGAEPVQEAVAS